ncbi:MAG: aminotransferase class I/II-fold pyridoxal phosphate-dependent enzyme [Bacteriovoracaceae bacterium]|jgi:aspartate/methionine/tyrosine aminotransferase|nr:aminotransferase class I/II-fold pyridoxal phosphate-dependent enzyme [Bacteriovoracaceae bacterium]
MPEIQINKNVLNVKESATLAINQKAKYLKSTGKDIYHWGFGQSPFPIPQAIQEELKNRVSHKEYLPTLGLEELRKTVADYYSQEFSFPVNPENIFIGPGSKELIFQLLYLLEGKVIIPAPSWVSYGPQIDLKGDVGSILLTQRKNDYKVQPQELDDHCKKLKSVQKILILNSPSNPTGQVYSDDELAELAIVLRKHKVLVISDEIYGQINFEHQRSTSLSRFYPERTIVTGGLSKAHSAGGYRLGYMIIPHQISEIISPLKAMISETFSAVAAPIQYAAIKAWDKSPEVIQEVKIYTKIHKACGHYFYERLKAMNIDSPKPQGAFYLFISFDYYKKELSKLGIKTSLDLCNYLLENYQIAVLPGEDFYYPKESLTARAAFVDYDGAKVLEAAKQSKQIDKYFVEENCLQIKNGLDQLEQFLHSLSSTK